MKTEDWKPEEPAMVLVIGHDPRLQKSDIQASYALFADYYFKPIPNKANEKKKYGLAKATYDHILFLTNNKIESKTIYITNLCNDGLPHAQKGKTVLIPKEKAQEGLNRIIKILEDYPTIEYIFPMSLQVNYWLQKLGFYRSDDDFVVKSEPKEAGMRNNEPYYEPIKSKTFLMICGNRYRPINGSQVIIPILHSKQFPLNQRTEAYKAAYERIRSYFK
jgi:hypothetical protein